MTAVVTAAAATVVTTVLTAAAATAVITVVTAAVATAAGATAVTEAEAILAQPLLLCSILCEHGCESNLITLGLKS